MEMVNSSVTHEIVTPLMSVTLLADKIIQNITEPEL